MSSYWKFPPLTTNITHLLRFYIKPLRILGMIPINYCTNENKYILQTGWSFYAAHFVCQLLCALLIGVLIKYGDEFFMREYTSIENHYWVALVSAALSVQILTNAWLLNLRSSHFRIISYCVNLSEELILFGHRKVYCLLQIIMVVSIFSGFAVSDLWSFEPWVIFQMYQIISSLLLAFYSYIIQLISRLLDAVNTSILLILERKLRHERVTDIELENFQNCLVAHDELLTLCTENISTLYGVIFILVTFISMLDITLCMYVMNFVIVKGFGQGLMSTGLFIILASKSIMLLGMVLVGSDIEEQANRTVKILTKFPRTGTGLDKMVDKFLLKNVRKKPILTAYGFFPLDRSALFKLFTAILMYVMILVQFKDIEKSLKKSR